MGYTTSEDIDEILEKIEHAVYSLNQENKYQKIYSISEIIDLRNEGYKNQKTNVAAFRFVQGFQKSDLIIIAGRPSMGKTAFSLNLAKNIVENYNIPLVIFYFRNVVNKLFIVLLRMLQKLILKSGKMSSLEWKTLSKTMKMISELPILLMIIKFKFNRYSFKIT
jgi:replicative DNA helicase